ncbi:FAD-linked oxidoreductase-like protein [Cubamyces lactineus]|nr:FAD-linked oxidoreductase-like protein [Cubamyces lactineus]
MPLTFAARYVARTTGRIPQTSGRHGRVLARAIASSSDGAAKTRSGWGTLRRLTVIGLASGTILGASAFLYDARAGLAAAASQQEGRVQSTTKTSKRTSASLSELVRTYVVFSFCSVPALVDWAPSILAALTAVPGLKQITEAVVRATFFNQFVGGDTAEDALPLIEGLRAQNTGCLFAYSVEVDEAEASGATKDREAGASAEEGVHKHVVRETLHCIDVAADFEDKYAKGPMGRRTWVAIKLSAMVPDAETLRRFSKYLVDHRPQISPQIAFPGCPLPTDLDVLAAQSVSVDQLTAADIAALRELREDLVAICTRARERGVRLIFDAEYSWYEPAIDAFTLDMMRRFNKIPQKKRQSWFHSIPEEHNTMNVQPLVYATYQAYLRRTPEYLVQSMAAARNEGYALGVKLVRGAYHPHELVAHPSTSASADVSLASPSTSTSLSISPDPVPPVWTSKAETDDRYNACVRTLVGAVREDVQRRGNGYPSIGVLFGTHNWESANLIVEELVRQGLATSNEDGTVAVEDAVAERVTMGQLYGMTVSLTNYLVNRVRSSSPFVIKYIPYGGLSEVMPYLSRRAIENKSVLGNGAAVEERRRAAAEIWAKLVG